MEKAKIYTKTGDLGITSTVDGTRLNKGHSYIDLYGEVDELNSWIGVLVVELPDSDFLKEKNFIKNIQNKLFDLGSNLACSVESREKYKLPQLDEKLVLNLEESIDQMTSKLPPLVNFILPGGCKASATAHICRTVCRRLERKMSLDVNYLPKESLKFINRLSDYLFVLARYVNMTNGIKEVIWHS